MKHFAASALMLSVLFAAGNASAEGHAVSASMQVSFTVLESCTVQAPDGAHATPTVACAHAAPVQVSSSAAPEPSAAPSQSAVADDGKSWKITF